jgi:monovalent cation:H+ antiporter, CPA1 family
MIGDETIAIADVFVLLLVALAAVAIMSRRFALPYTVALVVFGLLVAIFAPNLHIDVTPELVLTVLIPGLVFDAAFRMDARELRTNGLAVTLLAGPGVILVAVLTGVVLMLATGMDYQVAFLLGAMLSATDPVAVIATMRRVRVPDRLSNLVEAESLLNDGTGIVLFTIAISGLALVPDGLVSMLVTIGISIVVGGSVGIAAAWVAGKLEDENIELTLTIIAAYGSYLLADALHESGVIATVVAGITMGSAGRRGLLSPRARVAIDTTWGYLAFLLTALVFLLIGLTITPEGMLGALPYILWAIAAIFAGRVVVVYGLVGGLGLTGPGRRVGLRVPASWLHVLFWSGLRGAIAVALALSLPLTQADRSLLQTVVFGVVLFTLLVQGGTAEAVIRRAMRASP